MTAEGYLFIGLVAWSLISLLIINVQSDLLKDEKKVREMHSQELDELYEKIDKLESDNLELAISKGVAISHRDKIIKELLDFKHMIESKWNQTKISKESFKREAE